MLRRPLPWFLMTAIWVVVLCWFSHQSSLHPPGPEFEHRDKVIHAGFFALGGACLFIGLRLKWPHLSFLRVATVVVVFCSVVGALDEFHQSFIPNRSGNDFGDWLADTFGGVLAGGIGSLFLHLFKGQNKLFDAPSPTPENPSH